jgi:hypothetical protein
VSLPRPTASGWRDTLLFLTGLGLIIYEAVLRIGPERPTLLLLYAGMCGLPAFLRTGDARQSQEPGPESKP